MQEVSGSIPLSSTKLRKRSLIRRRLAGAAEKDNLGDVDPALPTIGTIVGQKYRIESVIGEGGMGVVFAATHEKLGQAVAIKMLLPEYARHPELVARFGREARASAQLRHRNSARVIDVDETTTGIPYMVMERLHGHDLETELEARGKLEIAEAVQYVVEACAAMTEAHQRGIVHRDLKPSNLFLSTEADGSVCVKVLDFGISKVQSEEGRITSTQHQMGTPLYMSPEQVRSAKSVDARTDVWSLGVILYELLTGDTPFKGSTAELARRSSATHPRSCVRFARKFQGNWSQQSPRRWRNLRPIASRRCRK